MTTAKIRTVRDAIRNEIEQATTSRFRTACVEHRNPTDARIGVLCRKGKPVYYAVIGGIYRESMDLAAIESDLASI